mmetsp:Transcript_1717/g.2957  ORF Transcript_1717/g.2957 Transcript_1717/m.2957 type:complete len:232 (+) Transcript_1717:363-1058(+)
MAPAATAMRGRPKPPRSMAVWVLAFSWDFTMSLSRLSRSALLRLDDIPAASHRFSKNTASVITTSLPHARPHTPAYIALASFRTAASEISECMTAAVRRRIGRTVLKAGVIKELRGPAMGTCMNAAHLAMSCIPCAPLAGITPGGRFPVALCIAPTSAGTSTTSIFQICSYLSRSSIAIQLYGEPTSKKSSTSMGDRFMDTGDGIMGALWDHPQKNHRNISDWVETEESFV